MICEKCGEDLTGKGLIAWVNHACNTTSFEYKVPTDNEVRIFFMEIGMPTLAFDSMGYAKPTEMERMIFEKERPTQQDTIFFNG